MFESWFKVRDACPTCGLKMQREDGSFLGAIALSYGVTGVAFIGVLVTWLVLTLPDVNVLALTLTSVGVSIVVPLIFYPASKTLWSAIDLLLFAGKQPDHFTSGAYVRRRPDE